ncbi:MAG: DUF4388 domain-containing protein [Planctomycetes bacterium]|nr:DUF4388 domain-containing protein [Planctomycetota bacterium]
MAEHVIGRTYLAGLFELVQIFEIHRRDIRLAITERGRRGDIFIQDGVLTDAQCDNLRGNEAVIELFHWVESDFELVELTEEPKRTIRGSNFDILMAGLQASEGIEAPSLSVAHHIKGPLDLLSATEILQLFEMNHRNAVLRLEKNGETGIVHLRSGRAVHAKLGETEGDEAIFELLTWLHGGFEIEVAKGDVPETVIESISGLVMEGMRRVDEQRLQEEEDVKKREELSAKTLKELEEGKLSAPMRIALAKRYLPRGGSMPVENLIELVTDPNMEVRQQALESISELPSVVIRAVMEDMGTPDPVFYHVAPKFADEREVVTAVMENPSCSDVAIARVAARATPETLSVLKEYKDRIAQSEEIKAAIARNEGLGAKKPVDKKQTKKKAKKRGTLTSQLANMKFSEKIFMAKKGSDSERMILVRNPDRRLGLAVLESPKTTAGQVESIASMKSVNTEVLEEIASRNEWTNQYPIAKAIVLNPKTPGHAAAPLVKKLRDIDLKKLARDRNVHESVRNQAKRRMKALEQKRK